MTQTIFEKSQKGQRAYSLPRSDKAFERFFPPGEMVRTDLPLPEISELDLTRHFSGLARLNMGIDTSFYPLGSCTMKLNPRMNEVCATMPGFTRTHPLAPSKMVQGNLRIIYELISWLCEIAGMAAGSLAPCAGAQGEFAGIRIIAAYHQKRGDLLRQEILVPDNAHGTNPATAALCGYKIVSIRTNEQGDIDLQHLRQAVSERTAGLMLTNPNTLGLFSPNILQISEIVHAAGGLLFYDGANLNAIMNIARPGEMGFDVMHMNLHKTFSTPHGGGGPGSGPVLCQDFLKKFLPVPRVVKQKKGYKIVNRANDSIGRISTFFGCFAVYLRAYAYILAHGRAGLRRVSEQAVLNANYLKARLGKLFTIPFSQPCMHEFVAQADNYLDRGVRAIDIAKRLLDYNIHAPTVYFPLIIKECLLIEPTETESKATLDRFVEILEKIVSEIQKDPEFVKSSPHNTTVARLDEVRAARNPLLKASI